MLLADANHSLLLMCLSVLSAPLSATVRIRITLDKLLTQNKSFNGETCNLINWSSRQGLLSPRAVVSFYDLMTAGAAEITRTTTLYLLFGVLEHASFLSQSVKAS
jgi:hypothetical protein